MKSTDNTVFVRFSPPSSDLKRWHLEEYFSQVGPIKKCSVIFGKETSGLGYGFVKFVSIDDAREAAQLHNNKSLDVEGQRFRLKVELASASNKKEDVSATSTTTSNKTKTKDEKVEGNKFKKESNTTTTPKASPPPVSPQTPAGETGETGEAAAERELAARRKRTCRVIVRNLSFYATEADVKKVLEKDFGPICEVTLPRVHEKLHRGFCFVTFETAPDAAKATQARKTPLLIKKRPVAIDFAMSKAVHQRTKKEEEVESSSEEEEDDDEEEEKDDKSGDDDSDEEGSSSGSDSDDDEEMTPAEVPKKESPLEDAAVQEHKTLFIRNLPFDTTRHDLFETMRPFGHIESIHPVMDRETGVFKGTAFVEYGKADQANKALAAANGMKSSSFQAQRDATTNNMSGGVGGELQLRGRRLLIDLAVDKKTASTLTIEKKQEGGGGGKDRRCLYLKDEGYIPKAPEGATITPTSWESLPESDQLKRFRALADKTTKLKSPLFFINPKRLSIRNLAKHVDEVELKQLCVNATERGLGRAKDEDVVAYWRAQGTITTRDIVQRINEASSKGESILPEFNSQNVKKYIPSVFIDRDFSTKEKTAAPSRGFGFVDFTHHSHAMACLRELNNNPRYAAEYVVGGKRAVDSKKNRNKKRSKKSSNTDDVPEGQETLVPRLIVEFTVENKAKSQQQAANRVKQQANVEKQRIEQNQRKKKEKKEVKKSRGKLQREKKRKRREEGADEKSKKKEEPVVEKPKEAAPEKPTKKKTVKPAKKRKVDKEEQSFANLVQSYTDKFTTTKSQTSTGNNDDQGRSRVKEKRWFE